MNAMSLSQWIFAATFIVAAVSVSITLARTIRGDGRGTRPINSRPDWGTPTMPSFPYNARR